MQESQTLTQIREYAREKAWRKIKTPTNDAALNEAIRLREITLVEPIIDNDIDLALKRAVYGKKNSIIPLLMPYAKNFHIPSKSLNDQCILHFAAMNGMNDVVELLIQKGAYINILDENGNTPLHIACKYNQVNTAILLLKLGANCVNNRLKQYPIELFTDNTSSDMFDMSSAKIIGSQVSACKALPTIKSSKYAWLQQNNLLCLEPISDDRQTSKTRAITKSAGLPSLNAIDLIAIEKKYQEVLNFKISLLLKSSNNAFYIDSTSKLKFFEYDKLAKKVITLEDNLSGCEFDVKFSSVQEGRFFLKSKHPVSRDILDKLSTKNYQLDPDSHLMILGTNLDNCITESTAAQNNHSSLTNN